MAQQQLGQPVAGPHQIDANLLARACQIARRLKRRRWHCHRRERAGHQLAQQMLGVLAVVLVTVTARTRRLARRDHLATHPRSRSCPIEPKARRARLIASVHRARQAGQPLNDRLHPPTPKPPATQLATPNIKRSSMHPARVDIHRRPCHRSSHGRALLRMGSAGACLRPVKPPSYATRARPSTSPTRHP